MEQDAEFWDALKRAVGDGVPQWAIAKRASMSQPHLSKILGRKVRLAARARQRLRGALEAMGYIAPEQSSAIAKLVRHLQSLPAPIQEPVATALLALLQTLDVEPLKDAS